MQQMRSGCGLDRAMMDGQWLAFGVVDVYSVVFCLWHAQKRSWAMRKRQLYPRFICR